MKKMILMLVLLTGIVISGCASDQGDAGGYESPSNGQHSGHHH